MSANSYSGLDLEALRAATRRLGEHEWLEERVAIAPGYTNDVLMVIEFADMHQLVMTALHAALRVALSERTTTDAYGALRDALTLGERALRSRLVESCRCGWRGEDEQPHLCHACHARPGSRRFYVPTQEFSIAGVQPKVSARETWGCDECWEKFPTREQRGGVGP